MVVDSSALLAILLREPERQRFFEMLLSASRILLSASNAVECATVILARDGDRGEQLLDQLIEDLSIDIVPVDLDQVRIARRALRLYGKGRHPAGLNYGDLFAYALSKVSGEPLLFKGDDFSKTDVVPAL